MKVAPVTLEALNKKIKGLIKNGIDSEWVIAEISELTINYSGHCYLELIQKDDKTDKLVARMRAIIWSNTFRRLQPYFESTTGRPFSEGIQVMVRVVVEFHEVYGLSLNIVDIEPTYTVGELQIRKQKILEKLAEQGVLEMNRELEHPFILNRIAVISSKTAAGLGDFMDQLHNNPYGFKFYPKLFPAIMQGNEAEGSIIRQLDFINNHANLFDAVVIIRGGGASADLECFNSYWLAYNVAQFPIPVFTGIGHEQDDTVLDIVANTRLKTPTAVAEFLIDSLNVVYNDLLETQQGIIENVQDKLSISKNRLTTAAFNLFKLYNKTITKENSSLKQMAFDLSATIKQKLHTQHKTLERAPGRVQIATKSKINAMEYALKNSKSNLISQLKVSLLNEKHNISKADEIIKLTDPKNVLRLGYSITRKDGKSIKDASLLEKGDVIETELYKGKKRSTIN